MLTVEGLILNQLILQHRVETMARRHRSLLHKADARHLIQLRLLPREDLTMLRLRSQIRGGIYAAGLGTFVRRLVLLSVTRIECGHAVNHSTRLLTASCRPLRRRLALGRGLERERDR